MQMENIKVSSSPHVRSKTSTKDIMFDVIVALMPAAVVGVYNFGMHSLLLIVACMVSAMISEYIFEKGMGRKNTVSDLSAAVTGLLLALNLPPELPLWMGILGSVFAIIVVKQLFGGIGQNFMNPALAARCFLLLSFSRYMTDFVYDGVSTATPLAVIKNKAGLDAVNIRDMFFGFTGGTIGETSTIALFIGALYLLIRKVISPKIPVIYIGSFAVCMAIYALAKDMSVVEFTLAQLCGGGLMLGAWFMATDYVTSPITSSGKVIYALFLGVLTFVLRIYGSGAEGVSYAIIIANILVPLIEKVTVPKCFGHGAENKDAGRFDGRSIVKAIVAIFIITVIMGAALGVVYNITKDPIASVGENAKQEAYKEVYPDASNIIEITDLDLDLVNEVIHQQGFTSDTINEIDFVTDSEGNQVGYIVIVTNKDGYGGDIRMVAGITNEGVVNGLAFLSINETAGLGMEAQNESFTEQFVGKQVTKFSYTKSGATSDDEIDALSGATITSSAVTDGVNAALNLVNLLTGGESNE